VKVTRNQLKELVRKSIYDTISEADADRYTHIGYGKYKEKGKEKDKDAPTFEKDDSGKFTPFGGDVGGPSHPNVPKKEPSKPKITKISKDPFADKDEPEDEFDVGGPSHPNVPKKEKPKSKSDDIKSLQKDIQYYIKQWDDAETDEDKEGWRDAIETGKKELQNLMQKRGRNESVTESKGKRYTIKEVRMWMKKLEENRYKRVYNADCRRVAWMTNNIGENLENMPKSMRKKWTKAQYGRERYLAKEFLKSKQEQMTEQKLRKIIREILTEGIGSLQLKTFKVFIKGYKKPFRVAAIDGRDAKKVAHQMMRNNKVKIQKVVQEGKLTEAKFKKIILPNDKKSQTITSKIIKKMNLRYQKDYEMLAHGSGPLKAKGGNQVITILPKHYNKFLELSMKNKLNVRG
jgi:hypothetical protein